MMKNYYIMFCIIALMLFSGGCTEKFGDPVKTQCHDGATPKIRLEGCAVDWHDEFHQCSERVDRKINAKVIEDIDIKISEFETLPYTSCYEKAANFLECVIDKYDCERLVDFSEYMNGSYDPDNDGSYPEFDFSECRRAADEYDACVANSFQAD